MSNFLFSDQVFKHNLTFRKIWPKNSIKTGLKDSESKSRADALLVYGKVFLAKAYSLCEGMSESSAGAACDVSRDVWLSVYDFAGTSLSKD